MKSANTKIFYRYLSGLHDCAGMNEYIIFTTPEYLEQLGRMSPFEQHRIRQFQLQLIENGNLVGKPLGVHYIREKKFNGKRMYYLIYEEWHAILLVGFSDKKTQERTITQIKLDVEENREFVFRALKEQRLI